ncbi:unnamed protein product [Effrenium voratum]|nr:unnamed protein product [Effrenium voratum]
MPQELESPAGFRATADLFGSLPWARVGGRVGAMSFAANLTKIVAGKKSELADREKIAESWRDKEAKLLDDAVDLPGFKQRCVKEAEQQKMEATISFEVITRDITDFPKRILTDSTYFVDTWPSGTSAESWFYATRGANSSWSQGAPILFAEVLQAMLPKFVDRVKELGFLECNHEAGTWKVAVVWEEPEKSERAPAPRLEWVSRRRADQLRHNQNPGR